LLTGETAMILPQ